MHLLIYSMIICWYRGRGTGRFSVPSKNPNVDLCGEAGEYHTFVTDGPLFKKRIKLIEVEKILNNGYWFWDIAKYEIYCK